MLGGTRVPLTRPMTPGPDLRPGRAGVALAALLLVAAALGLRWPTFGFSLWNVDEAIHTAAAGVILDGGVLYRDAVDQRTPLTYYAAAATFALFGENNLGALRGVVAGLVGATGGLLFLAARAWRDPLAGFAAGSLYVLLATAALSPGDANAANTEWFAAFFSSAAAAVFVARPDPRPARLFAAGSLAGCAFLSKQPALLDAAAPVAALLYTAWRQPRPRCERVIQLAAFAAGWLAPVLLFAAYFAVHGALADAVFYAWQYNLRYYGPEITAVDRAGSAAVPFLLIGGTQPVLLALWAVAAAGVLVRLAQRAPTPAESAANPGLVFVAVWSLAALAGAASGGRGFDHYSIQFLAPFCLGAGLAAGRLARLAAAGPLLRRAAVAALLGIVALQAGWSAVRARGRTLPEDPSLRVAAHIRAHSTPADRVFVWGFHPDIYLHSGRRPASRFLYASFVTGLIPWTNVAPDRDTRYAIVPGALDVLLRELEARPPRYLVDCSAGPNRHWQKYPLEDFPALHTFVTENYRLEEPHQFVPQGFRLYRRRAPGDAAAPGADRLPDHVTATLRLPTLAAPLTPIAATAPHGASLSTVDGRAEYFAHAPAAIVYRLPATAGALRGGFGIRAGAYAPDNRGPTDGVEFIIRWRPTGGTPQVLLRRLLRPREEPADRGVQPFRVTLETHAGGELELVTDTGPFGNSASDWSFWSDLAVENYRPGDSAATPRSR